MKGSLQTIRRPLGAVLLLFANLLALPCALPLLFAAAAALDGEHAVELRCNRAESAVILRHTAMSREARGRHHHGAIAAVLTGVADDRAGSVDHVLHFSGTEATDQAPPDANSLSGEVAAATMPVALDAPPATFAPRAPVLAHTATLTPQDSHSTARRALRSTVLRI